MTSFHYSSQFGSPPARQNSVRSEGIQNYTVPASIFAAEVIRMTLVSGEC